MTCPHQLPAYFGKNTDTNAYADVGRLRLTRRWRLHGQQHSGTARETHRPRVSENDRAPGAGDRVMFETDVFEAKHPAARGKQRSVAVEPTDGTRRGLEILLLGPADTRGSGFVRGNTTGSAHHIA